MSSLSRNIDKPSAGIKFTIPDTINIFAVLVFSFFYFALLLIASKQQHWYWIILISILFGIIMIPVYTLIHEAEHGIIHSNQFVNNFLGGWLCCLFIAPFSFFKHCHLRHHKKNRTDLEMWDLYYEHQNKWKKYGYLYFLSIGFGYISIVLSVVLFTVTPNLLYKIFSHNKEAAAFLEGSNNKKKIRVFRMESICVIIFQLVCFYVFNFSLKAMLSCFLIHGFIWSSQNYVNHAFSPRDIINGAHNLKMPVWLNLIYLNFNLHLAHHQNPKIPWIHLPAFIKAENYRISFCRNYLRLWKGPVLTHEPDPSKISPS